MNKHFLHIMFHRPKLEQLLYRLTYMWGAFLLLPINTFATSKGFAAMSFVTNETLWGLLIFLIGLRARNAYIEDNLKRRKDALFGVCIIWLFITTMIVISNPFSTGTVVYPMILYHTVRLYLTLQYRYIYLENYDEPHV